MSSLVSELWQIFVGTIERWNLWIATLEEENEAKEKQVLPFSSNNKLKLHAAIREYDEASFPFNLNGRVPHFTGHTEVDNWIQDFAYLNIDIFQLIRTDQTLPDEKFLKKRYIRAQKESHPDVRGSGSGLKSVQLNVARDQLELLYQSIPQQIELFQVILKEVVEIQEITQDENNNSSSSPYIILFLVGVGVGSILVVRRFKKKTKR